VAAFRPQDPEPDPLDQGRVPGEELPDSESLNPVIDGPRAPHGSLPDEVEEVRPFVVPQDEKSDSKKRSRPFWIEVPLLVVIALVIAIVMKTFLVQAFFIPSGSMEETLAINDRILVNKLAFRFGDPQRFDVVVFDSGESRDESLLESLRRNVAEALGLSAPDSDFIKRVIGLPGEVLEIRDGTVYIDGRGLDEPYLRPGAAMSDFGPVLVEDDRYFMMGDNRNLSSDSRFSGAVTRDRLVGRAFVIVWPPGNWDGL
jgi:signal peptidase I